MGAAGRPLPPLNADERTTLESWLDFHSLRWIYVHMIEEYARHNGHADLLRERIDGATGA
jgi:hypothetical protein